MVFILDVCGRVWRGVAFFYSGKIMIVLIFMGYDIIVVRGLVVVTVFRGCGRL